MSILEIVGLVGSILGILGVVIGVAVRLATSPLKNENDQLQRKMNEIVENQAKLVESLTLLKTAAVDAQALKTDIDQELRFLAQIVNVNSASVLIPYPPGQNNRLAFLSIMGPEASKLKHVYVNTGSSIAGEVYIHQQSIITNDTKKEKKWNPVADKRTAFTTENLLCVPMKYSGQVIGVAQFLNKPNEFNMEDRENIERAISSLTLKVEKFIQDVNNYEILGLGYAQDIEDGTVLLIDMSASSSLLKGAHPLPKTDVIGLINEYLEKVSTVAISHGFIVDKYMWDGCLFSLNVVNSIPNHKTIAYQTALEIEQRFDELKLSWLRAGYPAENLFCRVVITCGSVLHVDMGPAQYRQKTIVGDPVVSATALCANAPRNRNILIVDQNIFEALSVQEIKAQKVSQSVMGKAKGLIRNAYLVD